MIIKRSLSKTICGSILSCETVKDFLDTIGQKFQESDKADITSFLNSFSKSWYDNIGGVKSYILKIDQFVTRLREVNIPLIDNFVGHQVLDSSSIEYEQLKISYHFGR